MSHRVAFRSWSRVVLLAGVAAAAIASAAPACAQDSHQVDIAASSLEPALLSLASQTHQQILFQKALVAGRRAPALHGSMTTEQALAKLLAGAGLHARRVDPNVIVVERTGAGPTPVADAEGGRPFGAGPQSPGSDPVPTARDAEAKPPPPATVEEVRVTGSNIHGGAPPASPLLDLSYADLQRTGQATVADALKMLPENFAGGATEGANNTGSDRLARNGAYGTAINLRGLGNNATLVLVNGHRVASSGAFGDFVDISTIPLAAVQRVEVLLDGASAVYGSDAVGGVVNVITRKPFDGAETRLFGGIATQGAPVQGQVSQTFGKTWTGGGVVLTYELDQRNHLPGDTRSFAASADLRPFGGADQRLTNAFPGNILLTDPVTHALTPAFAIPAGQNGVGLRPGDFLPGVIHRTNQRQGVDLLPQQTLNALYVSAEQALGERLEVTADARYASRRYRSNSAPFTSSLTVNTANPFYVSPIGAPSEIIAYSFADELPNPVATGTDEALSFVLGAYARLFGDWRAEATGVYAQEIEEVRNLGVLNSAYLSEALGTVPDRPQTAFSTAHDGFFNPFSGTVGANSRTILDFISSGFAYNRSKTTLTSFDLQADGTVWSLPGGDLKLALGGQVRRETLHRQGSNFFSTVAPVAQAVVAQSRIVTAAFAELQAPLVGAANARPGLQRLDLSLSGRVEHYETFGTTANPKVGLVWAPLGDLRVRVSYGTSFRAPALREAFDTPLYTPSQALVGTTRIETLQLGGGNASLKPETADSWTAGVDYRPARWPGLALSLSAYDIRFHNRIDRPVLNNIANALTDPTLASFVTRISPATNAADRALLLGFLNSPFLNTGSQVFPPEAYGAIVDARYVNTANLRVRGLDLTGAYSVDLGQDRLTLGVNGAYVFDYEQQVTPTSATFQRVGLVNFPVRFRGRATADWTRGRLTVGGAVNYTDAYHDSLGARISDQATFDLQARLAPAASGPWRGVAVLFNVRNLFDQSPPFYNNPVGIGFDAANGDPIGRFVSLQLTRSW